MKKRIVLFLYLLVFLVGVSGVVYAAFSDKAKYTGTKLSVGNADIKLLKDLKLGIDSTNLSDVLEGPVFSNITPFWIQDYLVKIYNNASGPVQLTSVANYETVNDPDELRSVIYIEPFIWNDANSSGTLDTGELGASLGRKTIIKWKTEGYDIGRMESGEVKGVVLRFSADAISDTKQGKNASFDFEFSSAGL